MEWLAGALLVVIAAIALFEMAAGHWRRAVRSREAEISITLSNLRRARREAFFGKQADKNPQDPEGA